MAATASPDGLQLRAKPKISARLNRKAIFALLGVAGAVMVFVLTSIVNSNPAPAKAATPEKRTKLVAAQSSEITSAVPDNASRITAPPEVPPLEPQKGGAAALPAGKAASQAQPSREDQELAQAMRAPTALSDFAAHSRPSDNQADAEGGAPRSSPPPPRRDRDSLDAYGAGGPATEEPDINRQSHKREFRERAASDSDAGYRLARPRPPRSPFEIKTGSVLPAILITAINSDLPGEIVAQVSQNVFDTATGRYLLVPQGTKLFGRYDSAVTFGQERLMVVWTRLIFPDASTLELAGLAGVDKQGQSGFADQVNNHWGRTFGAAILSSLFAAGVQVSQPQPAANSNVAITPGQTAAGALGQQMGQFGIAIAKRQMQVQPTIEIRRGHPFAVMVGLDLVFRGPYGEEASERP